MKKPNIIYILADDWGYGDVSCLNPESKIPTPYTDAFAKQGMTFTDAHSNSAVCTPTRYGVLTGRYCWRSPLKRGVLGGYDDLLIERDRPTVASILKDAGYRTACIGKWHLGLDFTREGATSPSDASFIKRSWDDDPTVQFDKPITAGPHTVGFDYSLVIPASLDIPPYVYVENGQVISHRQHVVDYSPRPAFWRKGMCAEGLQHETCLLEFTMRAEQFIADHARETPDKPFFLYFPTPSPHTPHVPREPFQGKSQCGAYGDYVVEHDWSIGRIISTIDRLGLGDDTLIVITSDNGPHRRFSMDDGSTMDFATDFGHQSTGIYRGQKSDTWDGGHRVPFFVRWPGMVEAGSTCDQPICLTDMFATCAELVERPDDSGGEDSASMLPLLHGDTEQATREHVVHHSVEGQFAIRHGRWKLIEGPGSGGWSAPDNEMPEDAPPQQLYDMQEDPREQHNVCDQHPQVVEQLLGLLNECRQSDHCV